MTTNARSSGELEVVKNQYPDRDYEVDISIPEFTCVCPRTGYPDFATIEIRYVPNKYIVELKSLKLYLQKYRDVGIFHETVVNKILDVFRRACKPKNIEIVGRFRPRGGIRTNVRASWSE